VSGAETAKRALAWRRAPIHAVCDRIEPWEHGIVARASEFPSYYDYNVVVVEGEPGLSVAELEAVADEALAGLEHRRMDFEDADAGDARRDDFTASGWRSTRLVWMRHEEPPPAAEGGVEWTEVPYDAVADLRLAWYREDFPDQDPGDYHRQARVVAERLNVQVIAVHDGERPVGFAQLERHGDGAEVTQVFVHPDYRGAGRGTAMTRAAIEAAGDVRDLWIIADDEDRPKELYARLGFRTAVKTMEFTRWPPPAAAG
jgi:GNAT superfamily N-acetyltransferase